MVLLILANSLRNFAIYEILIMLLKSPTILSRVQLMWNDTNKYLESKFKNKRGYIHPPNPTTLATNFFSL